MRRVNIGRVFADSSRAFGNHLGALVLGGVLMCLCSLCVILVPVLVAGYCMMCLSALRNEEIELTDIFDGFGVFAHAYAVGLAYALVYSALTWVVALPLGGTAAADATVPTGLLWATTLVGVALIPFYALGFPAVADGEDAIDAMRFSITRGVQNWPSLMVISLMLGAVFAAAVGVATLFHGWTFLLVLWGAYALLVPWSTTAICAAYDQVAEATPI